MLTLNVLAFLSFDLISVNLRWCNVFWIRMNPRIWRLREFHHFCESRPELLRSRQLLFVHQLGMSLQKFPVIDFWELWLFKDNVRQIMIDESLKNYVIKVIFLIIIIFFVLSKLTKALSKCLAMFSRWLTMVNSAMIIIFEYLEIFWLWINQIFFVCHSSLYES